MKLRSAPDKLGAHATRRGEMTACKNLSSSSAGPPKNHLDVSDPTRRPLKLIIEAELSPECDVTGCEVGEVPKWSGA